MIKVGQVRLTESMRRERALKVVLVLLGLLFSAGIHQTQHFWRSFRHPK
jgi:hypothetical protein